MLRTYGGFALRRTGQAIVVVLLAYLFTFFVLSILPGDPISSILRTPDAGFTEDDIARIVAYYGLDQPWWVQLGASLGRFVIGDLGVSLRSNLPVSTLVLDALGSTLSLAAVALLVAIVLAVAIAYGTQFIPARFGQGVVRSLPSLFLSVPNFVIGLLLIHVFAFGLGLFSMIDTETPWGTFFAAVALGIPVSAQLAEVLIASLDHESRQEYVAVARSRGLRQGALFARHLVKPSALPTVTVLALIVGELLGGALITEAIFGRVGIGTLVEQAVASQDLPVLQAVVSLAAIVFVVVNLLADLAYPLLDPRVSIGSRTAAVASRTEPAPLLREEVSIV
ncbi:ABC transporter permease [Microbacterium trichothecenolyticum]|uniref:Peptide/nickel transport system permease protein n=1 Tax=Microbacterium trichothecenolyticum TaxID=69370 RepID=A0ABU0TVR3_MICTR|nr:ABC transporter permease [Microbacterium trichothecenolyticum]MDQ1123757.1 peptide/nickel transport system permease protein [Microbacterium trichothecenolyticum]